MLYVACAYFMVNLAARVRPDMSVHDMMWTPWPRVSKWILSEICPEMTVVPATEAMANVPAGCCAVASAGMNRRVLSDSEKTR